MKIGEFAKRSGISVRMLRFYEGAGILVPARTPGGYREYREQDIALMRDCLNDEPQNFCPALRSKLADTLAHIGSQIESLRQSEQLLADLLVAEGKI